MHNITNAKHIGQLLNFPVNIKSIRTQVSQLAPSILFDGIGLMFYPLLMLQF